MGLGRRHGCIVIAIHLPIVFAEIINFATNNHFYTFANFTRVASPTNSNTGGSRLIFSVHFSYFLYIFYHPQRILLDFPSVTSLAYMPFLSCHRTTPTLSPPLDEILVRRNFRLTFGWRSTHCTSKDIIIIISRSWYRHCQISCWGASNLCCNYALHEIDLAPNGILSDYANWSIIIKLDSVWIRKFQQIYLWVRLPQ